MKKIKLVLGLSALVIAVTAAFSFTTRHTVTDSKFAPVWLKYDCSIPNQVLLTGSTNIWSEAQVIVDCPGTSPIKCAEKYNSMDDLEPYPGHPNHFRKKTGSTPTATRFCP